MGWANWPAEEGLQQLLAEVRGCQACANHLPNPPRPVLRASTQARILLVGQAPGTRVQACGIPWHDPSGNRLREWLGVDRLTFYDPACIAIVPMGFCYPGKGKSGDLPPRPECAELWQGPLRRALPNIELTLLVGQYAQQHYLRQGGQAQDSELSSITTLTERVRRWQAFAPHAIPLPHPSPRNQLWLKRNPWFEAEVIPHLQQRVATLLASRHTAV